MRLSQIAVKAETETGWKKMLTAHRQWASWFWILFGSNNNQGIQIDATPEKGQEYQAVRIIGKDTHK
jgi:hypothetical protein